MVSASRLHVKGSAELSVALRGIPEEMRGAILIEAVRRACKPIEIAAKRYAKRSEDTGALRASITTKAVGYPRNGKAAGLVGPDKAAYAGKRKAGKGWSLLIDTRKPSKYAHLVEFGHHAVSPVKGATRRKGTTIEPKSGTKWVAAKPFLRPAVQTTHAQQSAEFYKGLAAGFEKSRKKYVKAGMATSN